MPFRIACLPFVFALLFWASFHPVNAGFLGWVCLIPLLVFARRTSGKKAFFVAWAGGAVAFTACFLWVRHTVPPGPVLLGAYNGVYVAVFVVIIRRLGAAWTGIVWPALELVRGHLFTGLPWFNLGYTQEEAFHLIQIADIGGVWLVTALVAFVNGALVDGRRAVRWGAAAAVLLSWIYGAARVSTIEEAEGPTIAVVQPNIPQDLKLLTHEQPQQAVENYRKHLELTRQAAAAKPDLVCWPEASIYRGIAWDAAADAWLKTAWLERVRVAAKTAEAPLLIGLLVTDLEPDGERYTNSALWVLPDGEVAGRFDKVHLVPFAELIPVEWVTKPIIKALSDLRLESMRAGKGFPIWQVAGSRFGVQICFEAIFPEISREIARKGAAFTVNISNDGWFRDSAELDQMQVMSRFRAVESRIGFVRATNTGISSFTAPTGREVAILEVGGRRKEVGGVLTSRIPVTGAGSLYRTWGDAIAWGMAVVALVALGRRILFDRRREAT